jgi:hypothetical protein
LWDQVIAKAFVLPPGRKLPHAFLLLMRDWVQDSGERYDYTRPYGMSDQDYVYLLLSQAHLDAEKEVDELLSLGENAIEQQWHKAIDDFYRDNMPTIRN